MRDAELQASDEDSGGVAAVYVAGEGYNRIGGDWFRQDLSILDSDHPALARQPTTVLCGYNLPDERALPVDQRLPEGFGSFAQP